MIVQEGRQECAQLPVGALRESCLTSVCQIARGWRDGSVRLQPADQGALGMCDPVVDDPDGVIDTHQRSADGATIGSSPAET
jgi:hypothetical protein